METNFMNMKKYFMTRNANVDQKTTTLNIVSF